MWEDDAAGEELCGLSSKEVDWLPAEGLMALNES